MSIEIKITKEWNGIKPRSFLKKIIDVPYFQIPKLIKDKRITLNGKKIKKDSIMKNGDILKIWPDEIQLRDKTKYHKQMKDLNIPIIFENEDFIVFNKLSGIIVQGAQDNETSLSLHLAYYKNKIKDDSDFEYFHVHRLDKETSGILVVAKNMQTLSNLNKIFRTREILKKYVCLCSGEFEKKEGKIEIYLKRTEQGKREKVQVCEENDNNAKKSLSYYKVIKEFEFENENLSLIEIEIKTGIMHQIRVHMKYLKHQIIGDKMYGNTTLNKKFEKILKRQFLHAKSINFELKGEKYSFDADFTEDLKNTIEYITN